MDTVTILRRLWRFRLFVALIALVAIFVGVFISYEIPSMKSRKYTVAVGSARILVDTPASQVVDLSPEGSDSVGARAALLANLMVDGEIKDAIARDAGLRPNQLIGINQDAGLPAEEDAGTPPRGAFVLSPEVTMISNNEWLPIIQVNTQAPNLDEAEKLANAAVHGLTRYLDSKAATEAIPNAKRLKVSGLGAATARAQTRGPSMALSLGVSIVLLLMGCALLIGISELVRALRAGPQAPEAEPVAPPRAAEPSPQPVAPAPVPGQAAQLYELDPRRSEHRSEEPVVSLDDKRAAASGAPTPPPSRDRASWWGGGPS